jgi:hypothetical protein
MTSLALPSERIYAPPDLGGRKVKDLFLHSRQMEVYRSPHRFKVVVAGRRWGKTQLALMKIIKYARVKQRLVWYVAPSYRMAKQIMWPSCSRALPGSWIKKINETTLTDHARQRHPDRAEGRRQPRLAARRGHPLPGARRGRRTWIRTRGRRCCARRSRRPAATRSDHRHAQGLQPALRAVPCPGAEASEHRARPLEELAVPHHHLALHPAGGNRGSRARGHGPQELPPGVRGELSKPCRAGSTTPSTARLHVRPCAVQPERAKSGSARTSTSTPCRAVILQPQGRTARSGRSTRCVLPSAPATDDVCDELERRYFKLAAGTTTVLSPTPPAPIASTPEANPTSTSSSERGFVRQKYRRKHPPVADRVNAVNRMLKRGGPAACGSTSTRSARQADRVARADTLQAGRPRDRQGRLGRAQRGRHRLSARVPFPVRKIDILGVSI